MVFVKATADSEQGALPGPSELEIRPVVDMADFGEAVTPDIVERENKMRDQLSQR